MQHLEDQECYKLVQYLDIKAKTNDIIYSHIAQSTYTKSWAVKNRNTALWVKPWVPDYDLIINWKFFKIEMKKSKGWVVSPNQKKWIEQLKNAWIDVFVCNWFEEAKEVIDWYLKR